MKGSKRVRAHAALPHDSSASEEQRCTPGAGSAHVKSHAGRRSQYSSFVITLCTEVEVRS